MKLLPSIELVDPCSGRCFRLGNNCQTLAYMKRTQEPRPRGWDSFLSECDDCCPTCLDDPSFYGARPSENARWGDPQVPASDEFFGLLIETADLEPATSVRRMGETLEEPVPYTPRRLVVTGTLVSSSRRGAVFGERWLRSMLTACSNCTQWDATVWEFCSGDGTQPDISDLIPTFEPEPLDPAADPCDCDGECGALADGWVAPPLEPADDLDVVPAVDGGRRLLRGVRLVSMDDGIDESGMPLCEGKLVTLVFEVGSDFTWGDPIHWGSVSPPDLEARCRPFSWSCTSIPAGQETCVESISNIGVDTTGQEPVRAEGSSVNSVEGAYQTPHWRSVSAQLTPLLPQDVELSLSATFSAGSAPLSNVRLQVWPAFNGVPSPATCEGEKVYRGMMPCTTGEVAGPLPAGGVLTVDGVNESTTLTCDGATPELAENLLTGRWGGSWSHPLQSSRCRYWLVVTWDCYGSADDAQVDFTLTPRLI